MYFLSHDFPKNMEIKLYLLRNSSKDNIILFITIKKLKVSSDYLVADRNYFALHICMEFFGGNSNFTNNYTWFNRCEE